MRLQGHCYRGDGKLKGLTPGNKRSTVWLDTETTGLLPKHQLIEVAAIKRKPGGMLEYYESKIAVDDTAFSLAEPRALEITGFRRDEWAGAPPLAHVMTELLSFIWGQRVFAHNVDFDLWQIDRHAEGVGLPRMRSGCNPVACTMWLARDLIPDLKSHSLDSLCRHFDIPPEGAHRAMGGATRCMKVWEKLCGSKFSS